MSDVMEGLEQHGPLVVWEGERCFALSKPAGLPVFPPHADPEGDCVLRRLGRVRPEQLEANWPFGFAGGIAHRLDVSTSGQLLVARSPEELVWLRELFARKWLRKRYRLCTLRTVPWTETTVEARISHDRRRKGRMVVERGKSTPHRGKWYPARTDFSYLGALVPVRDPAQQVLTGGLWAAEMRTGVMHQVRIHAAFAGIALAGDGRYGGGEAPWPHQAGVHFLLHHLGLEAPGLEPAPVPLPTWWPVGPSLRGPLEPDEPSGTLLP